MYEQTDEAILAHNPNLGRGGSTVVTTIIVDGEKLWVAHVGDSEILSNFRNAIQMSTDPNLERSSFELLIQICQVRSQQHLSVSIFQILGELYLSLSLLLMVTGDLTRVNGQLAVSRAFGDRNLKTHLRSDPDIQFANTDCDTELLILASDGLWKVSAKYVKLLKNLPFQTQVSLLISFIK